VTGSEPGIRSTVELYLKADLQGATLGSDNFARSGIGKLIIPGEEIAPGWDTCSVVTSYAIDAVEEKMVKGQHLAIVSVTYAVVAEVSGATDVEHKKEREKYVFRLVKQGNDWKLIDPYDLKPHVSIDTLIAHLKTLLGQEHQEKVPDVIHQLEKMKGAV
jgi:hypothetical protein